MANPSQPRTANIASWVQEIALIEPERVWKAISEDSEISEWHPEEIFHVETGEQSLEYAWPSLGLTLPIHNRSFAYPSLTMVGEPALGRLQNISMTVSPSLDGTSLSIRHENLADHELAGTLAGWKISSSVLGIYLRHYEDSRRTCRSAVIQTSVSREEAYSSFVSSNDWLFGKNTRLASAEFSEVLVEGIATHASLISKTEDQAIAIWFPKRRTVFSLRAIELPGLSQNILICAQSSSWSSAQSGFTDALLASTAKLSQRLGHTAAEA